MTQGAGAESDFVALRAGQSVGRYTIVSVLGHGGFGITYRATDQQLGRDIAIKEYLPAALAVRQDGATVLPRSKSSADDFAWGRDRFVAEGRTLAALHHASGIVRVHDFLEANGTAYLVMELLGGGTLHDRLVRQGTLDAAAIDRIVRPLLDGLEQVHAAGFLHRDIKPANILLDGDGRPTLIDFGASRAAVAGRSQAMTAVFTPGYAAVEQFTAATQGPWTDIYGLAATLHHAIAGQAPPNSIDRMLDDSYAPLAGTRPAYPPGLLAGIDAGLAVRSADRPQSIAAWRSLLLQSGPVDAAATSVMRAAPFTAPAVAAPARKRRGLALAAGGVAAVAALVGAYLGLSPSPVPTPPIAVAAPPVPAGPSPQEVAARRAQEELELVRRDQQKAVEENARLRAEADARRKADEEAALRRKIEEEMRQKAEADAEARRQAEQDAKQKADAEAAARVKAEEDDKKTAELAEGALRLTQSDRQRLQLALTSLGYSTGGSDGAFGARSREMIAAWQRKNGHPATGYLKAAQPAALLREAAPALARYDEEQRKIEEDKRKPTALPPAVAQAPVPPKGERQCEGTFRSQWCRAAFEGFPASCWSGSMTVRNGVISDGWAHPGDPTQRNVVTGSIDGQGAVVLSYDGIGSQTNVNRRFNARMTGSVADGVLTAGGQSGPKGRPFTVRVQCR